MVRPHPRAPTTFCVLESFLFKTTISTDHTFTRRQVGNDVGRDRIVVSISRCGRDNPGSNPGHGTAIRLPFWHWCMYRDTQSRKSLSLSFSLTLSFASFLSLSRSPAQSTRVELFGRQSQKREVIRPGYGSGLLLSACWQHT